MNQRNASCAHKTNPSIRLDWMGSTTKESLRDIAWRFVIFSRKLDGASWLCLLNARYCKSIQHCDKRGSASVDTFSAVGFIRIIHQLLSRGDSWFGAWSWPLTIRRVSWGNESINASVCYGWNQSTSNNLSARCSNCEGVWYWNAGLWNRTMESFFLFAPPNDEKLPKLVLLQNSRGIIFVDVQNSFATPKRQGVIQSLNKIIPHAKCFPLVGLISNIKPCFQDVWAPAVTFAGLFTTNARE